MGNYGEYGEGADAGEGLSIPSASRLNFSHYVQEKREALRDLTANLKSHLAQIGYLFCQVDIIGRWKFDRGSYVHI